MTRRRRTVREVKKIESDPPDQRPIREWKSDWETHLRAIYAVRPDWVREYLRGAALSLELVAKRMREEADAARR